MTLASIDRTGTEAAVALADTAIAELGCSRQRTAYTSRVGRRTAMRSAWPTIGRRGMGGIDRTKTQFGIDDATAGPSNSPTIARRAKQRGPSHLIPSRRLLTIQPTFRHNGVLFSRA